MQLSNTRRETEAGFTMIEISMSLVFIAFIIIFLTASLMSLFGTYNKGIWLSKVDQTVRQMRLDISDSVKYAGRSIVLFDKDTGKPYRLCSNGVSYLWNTEPQLRKHKGKYNELPNYYSDAHNVPLKLVRVLDASARYCKPALGYTKKMTKGDIDKVDLIQPKIDDTNVQTLLSTGVALQYMQASQGARPDVIDGKTVPELDRIVPMLQLKGAISTEGINAPTLVKYDYTTSKWVVLKDDEEDKRKLNGSSWQCGDWFDKNENGIRDEGDVFRPSKAQFCANTSFDLTVYERGVIR